MLFTLAQHTRQYRTAALYSANRLRPLCHKMPSSGRAIMLSSGGDQRFVSSACISLCFSSFLFSAWLCCCRAITGENVNDSGVPADFLTAWNEAVTSKSRSAKSALFTKWLQAGGDWNRCLAILLRRITLATLCKFQIMHAHVSSA